MTEREWLAVIVLVVPLLGLASAVVVPERHLSRAAATVATLTAVAALMLAAIALIEPGQIFVGRWLVIDPAGGLIVGVIGIVGLASVLASPSFLSGRRGSLFRADRAERAYWATLFAFWAVLARGPARREPRRRVARDRGDDRGVRSPRRVQRPCPRARGRVEVPDPDLPRPRRRAARDPDPRGVRRAVEGSRHYVALAPDGDARPRGCGRRLRAPAGGPRREGRLGARPQLAPRRPFGGTRPGLGTALGSTPPGRPARRLALAAGARAVDRRTHIRRRAGGIRARLDRRRGALPLAPTGLEAPPRLLQPRAHGRDRPRGRVRRAARSRRGRDPRRRPRAGQGARVLRRDAPARPRASRWRPCGRRHRTDATGARHVARSLARNTRRAAAVAAFRQRGPDRRGGIPGGAAMGRRRRRDPPRPRVPRPRPRACRHGRRASRRRDRGVAPGIRVVTLLTAIVVPMLLALTAAALWLPDSAIVDGLRGG